MTELGEADEHPEPHEKLHERPTMKYPAGQEDPHALKVIPVLGAHVTELGEALEHPEPHEKLQLYAAG